MNHNQPPMSWDTADENRYEQSIALKIPGYSHMHDLMERLLAASISGNNEDEILIVGAGGGKELALLGTRHAGWTFTGIDPSEPMLQLAKRRVQEAGVVARVQLKSMTIEGLPEEEIYDGATSMLMLHFIQGMESKRRFLSNLAARLKSGAPLIIAAVNADLHSPVYPTMMQAWQDHMLSNGILPEEWEQFAASLGRESDPISSEQMIELLAECGFSHITRYFGAFWVEGYYAKRI
ncbi:MAG TPA: class I SAM-dependent methyltransferase [Paenibacillus sp.]|uniref:Class I SAM-dependent methyltransferase n=1 Tax=Paenibacillus vandeheii TaxID=3035917 RepID=A0ABT8JFL9_9BACL|nr:MULTISPECIES: class I SAM-dependent methyltransferase [Paenibacillus]MDN4603391.1 class I SAM-dependent methyltransferase [Paenibacillus vandeheii]OZQ72902.1 SAM-dependent methyltransferase [Paenibacillus taichungensis]HBU81861.1 class I SAM-dependent methyltransferase [Paenibacillus sp.]